MSETVESLRQQALAIGVELAIALYGETPHPAQQGRYDREVAEATAIIDAFEAAAKREASERALRWAADNRRLDRYINPEYTMRNPETVEAYIERALNALAKEGE